MNYSEKYNYTPDPLRIASSIESIIADADSFASTEVYKSCFSFMDLTTLQAQDTVESVSKLVSKVIDLCEEYPSYPLPASICVYPNFACCSINAPAPNFMLQLWPAVSSLDF